MALHCIATLYMVYYTHTISVHYTRQIYTVYTIQIYTGSTMHFIKCTLYGLIQYIIYRSVHCVLYTLQIYTLYTIMIYAGYTKQRYILWTTDYVLYLGHRTIVLQLFLQMRRCQSCDSGTAISACLPLLFNENEGVSLEKLSSNTKCKLCKCSLPGAEWTK